MNNEARLYKKLLILTTVVFVISTSIIVLHYETDSSPKFIGDKPKTYAIQEIRNMIKELPDYQGDSILIDEDGKLTSLDGLIQSTLEQVYVVDANLVGVKSEAKASGLPEPYLVYKTGIKWYIGQYGKKLEKNPDTLKSKRSR